MLVTHYQKMDKVILSFQLTTARVLTVQPAMITSLKAGVSTSVTLTITVLPEGTHCQGGVVKARVGKRNVPTPLNVKVIVSGGTSRDG